MTATAAPPIDIVRFTTDENLLGLSLSPAQETLLRAIYGLPLTDEQLDLWRRCTAREDYPAKPFSEATVIAGARSGKDSRIAAPIAVFEAIFGRHEVAKGEKPMIPIVAQDARASKIAFSYIRQYLEQSPLLRDHVLAVRANEIDITDIDRRHVSTIACFPCTVSSLRGWSIPCGIMDELAFYRFESSFSSDIEIQTSIRRGMIGFERARLIKISTPYLRSGILYQDYTNHYAKDSEDILVWTSDTVTMNPSISEKRLERERRLDPLRYEREYEAQFVSDVESFIPIAWVEAARIRDRHELPPQPRLRYAAGVDVSGGAGKDAFALSICHLEGDRVVQDLLKSWRRQELEATVREVAEICFRYRVFEVWGDRYASNWTVEAFRRMRVSYRNPLDYKTRNYLDRSALYQQLEPLFATHRIDILDNEPLCRELMLLERANKAGGKPRIDHPRRGSDDLSNSLAAAAVAATSASHRGYAIVKVHGI